MNKLLRYIFTFFIFFYFSVAFGQPADSKTFLLPGYEGHEPKIFSLFQNSQGYLLVGTTIGLFRFDGIDFIKYDHEKDLSAAVTAICEIKPDEIWIGYADGRIATLKKHRIEPVTFEEGFPHVAIKKIVADNKGTIWIATAGEGVYLLNNDRLGNINTDDGLSDNYVYDAVYNNHLGIVASTDRGLNVISLDNGKKIVKSFTSKDGLPDNIVRCLDGSAGNELWFGMEDGGIASCSNKLQMISNTRDWVYGQVNDIIITASQIFAATAENGLLVFEKEYNNTIGSFSGSNTNLKKITTLLRDKEGNIWAAGDNKLMLTAGSKFEFIYSFNRQTAEKIHALLFTKDKSIWFNSGSKVIKLTRNPGGWSKNEFNIPGIDTTDISVLYEDIRGSIWIGTLGKGIFMLDPVTGKWQKFIRDSLLLNGNIISISGKNNTIWLSSLEGTFSVDIDSSSAPVLNYAGKTGIENKYVYSVFEDSRNRTWFATDGNGIALMQDKKFMEFDSFTHKYGNVVYKFVEDRYGNIWFSTFNRGLTRFDGKRFYNFGIAEGLSDLNITGLAISNNNLAAFHRNRIDIVSTHTKTVSYLDEEQGLYNINTDLNAYTSDNEGNLYFIADTILCKYHASYNIVQQPKVMIDRVQVFLEDIHSKTHQKFRYYENNFSFYYTGLYYTAPGKINYQYKLDGYDEDWQVTKDRVKNFPQLAPGTYTFRVKASINNIFTSAPEATFTFTISKPFWQTPWFIVLSVIVLGATIYLLVKAREKHFEKLNTLENEKIRSQLETLKSQINPHFLFNSFNTLISEIEENPAHAVTYVEKLSDFYRSIVSYREKDLIVVGEELELLLNYFFIQQKRYGKALQIKTLIDQEQARKYCIAPLALQLLIENAVKHNVVSLATPLLIELFINEEEYLVVRNNISRKMVEEKGSGLGLENIKKRYDLLSTKAVVVEKTEQYFTVKIPLIKK